MWLKLGILTVGSRLKMPLQKMVRVFLSSGKKTSGHFILQLILKHCFTYLFLF